MHNKNLTYNQKITNCYRLFENNEKKSAKNVIQELLDSAEMDSSTRAILTGLNYQLDRNTKKSVASFKLAINEDKENLDAHYYLASSYLNAGLLKQASNTLSQIISIDESYAKAWFLQSIIARKRKNTPACLNALLKSVKYDIDNALYWGKLWAFVSSENTQVPLETINNLIIEALTRHKLDPEKITSFIYSALEKNTSLQKLKILNNKNALSSSNIINLLSDELLLAVIQSIILYGPDNEILLTNLRKTLLYSICNQSISSSEINKTITSISALGIYNLATEFVFYVSEEELKLLEQCKYKISENTTDDQEVALLLAIIGCYELLHGVDSAIEKSRHALSRINNIRFQSLIHYHINEKEQEYQCKKTIIPFSPIEDDTSQAVQQQYEENPYPRWINWGGGSQLTLKKLLTNKLPYLQPQHLSSTQSDSEQPIDILIAGCGTGRNAIMSAKGFYNANVYAVDLSQSSLAYAIMKSNQYGIENITFRHGDLLNLPSLNRQFDMVDSSGVLHHMKHPEKGLSAIEQCLKPGGWMRIALYSHIARNTIRQAQQKIRSLEIKATPSDIREFRRAVLNNLQHPLRELCTKFQDFYSMSECRDLIFHVQEHQFTTAQLKDLIASFNLKFMGFEQVDPALYKKGSPITDPQSLEQWGIFEKAHPSTFSGMYHMWLHKPL